MLKLIILPGNGCVDVYNCNWYGWLAHELEAFPAASKCQIILKEMPDPYEAKEEIWIPFIVNLGVDEDTIVIGHSSGAVAAMRLLEKYTVASLILVSTYHTDLGCESERPFPRPWDWQAIKAHSRHQIIQFASVNDKLVPFEEQEFVHKHIGSELIQDPKGGHFMFFKFPKLLSVVLQEIERLQNENAQK